ncbi:MAG: peptidase M16 [Confluentimicrobium sp.]|nr:peptidase M16 [Actibacterium sp.]
MIRFSLKSFATATATLATCLTLIVPAASAGIENVEEVTSDGGITAWLVTEPSIPFTALEIRFRGGTSLDPEGKPGAINLMTALLEEGAGERSAQEFAAAREGLAASYAFDVGRDTLSVSARFLTENRDEAVDLLRSALIEPRFDQEALDRVRGQVLSIIASNATDPGEINSRAFNEAAFPDHPYALPVDGTVESVTALTRDDMLAVKDRVMARDRIYVSAVGDMTAAELGPLLDRLLGDLPETGAPLPEHVDYALPGGVDVVEFDTPQSVVSFAQPGIPRDDPDFIPAYIMMEIFSGGGFSSRLMEEVREKRGLTYGIGASLYPMDNAELIIGSVSSANDKVAETIEVIKAEWAKLAEDGITQEELDRAKTYLTGAYPLRFDGNGRIANILVGMQMTDLPIDYPETRNELVDAVTLEDINRVVDWIIEPERLHFVVVGKPAGLE